MTNYAGLEHQLTSVLHLSRRPVAVSFRDTPPDGVPALTGSQPSGCSFWRLAAAGRVFYTVPSDHFNCPIGSFTHNITLPEERQVELTRTLGLMIDIGYIKLEEIPNVPRLPKTPPVTIYAPLAEAPVDLVLGANALGHGNSTPTVACCLERPLLCPPEPQSPSEPTGRAAHWTPPQVRN